MSFHNLLGKASASSLPVFYCNFLPCFQVGLHFRQVKVRTQAILDLVLSIMEEKEAEIKDGSRHGLSVDKNVLFQHVPASRSYDQCSRVLL